MKNNFEFVFVYGSLKREFGNHDFLLGQEYIGHAVTAKSEFVMVSLGAFPAVCRHENAYRVAGEVYKVDTRTMASLDYLEGNGKLYAREQVDFVLGDGSSIKAWVYLMPMQVAQAVFARAPSYRAHSVHTTDNIMIWL